MHSDITIASLIVGLLFTGSASAGDRTRSERPTPSLRIVNVRLEPLTEEAIRPTAVLKFDLLNEAAVSVTDVVLEISIVEDVEPSPRRVIIVAPFTVRAHATIDAGYTVNYTMLLRNLSPDCACIAKVSVLSARPLLGSSR
jgi:hypothetical protein